jgi:hypothetical protein
MKKEDLQERLFHLENGIVKTIYKMKTCKYGCGKVTAVKKMKTGGSAGCPIGQCPEYVGSKSTGKCVPCRGVLAGLTAGLTGAVGTIAKMASDKNKANKAKNEAVKKIMTENPNMKKKEAIKMYKSSPKEEKKLGGAKKKYAMGGNTGGYAPAQKGGDNVKMGIYGIPNAGRTDSLGFKKGGSTTNRAVSPGCRGGMVKDASGKCVNERPRFKKGGFPDLNKDGKVTRADILKGRGVIKKMGGAKKR